MDTLENNRNKRFGLVMRLNEHRQTIKATELKIKGKGSIERPRTRCEDQLKQDLERRGTSWEEVIEEQMWEDRVGSCCLVQSPIQLLIEYAHITKFASVC